MKSNEPEDGDWSDVDEELLARIDLDFKDVTAQNVTGVISSKFNLECDRILEKEGPPLRRYRPKYLIVSDLAAQYWCEQKLLYGFSPDVFITRVPVDEEVKLEDRSEIKAIKGKGSDIHLARELEVKVPVEVPVKTKEDKWAVKFLNMYTSIHGFYNGSHIAREIPVFGCPFDRDVFVYGIIDEIQYDPSSHTLKISELKTRQSRLPPGKSQQEKDKFQVGMYRQLFNELVMNKVTKQMVSDHLHLDLTRPLSEEVQAHFLDMDISPPGAEMVMDLGHILNFVFDTMQSMTCIQFGRVEYVNQDTKLTISLVELDKDESEIGQVYDSLVHWWKGERGTRGVDVEDCWKCEYCPYSGWCEWRDVMAEKMSGERLAKVGSKMGESS